MANVVKYTTFQTGWGYFGILGTEKGLLRTSLPTASVESAKADLLKNHFTAESSGFFADVQEMVKAYFEGGYVDFRPMKSIILLDGFSDFAKRTYMACMETASGSTTSYSQLALKVESALHARAVANCLAHNPLPLIVPCHRVIRSDGRLGGFSGTGGIRMKEKLLEFEQNL